ncbi:Bug family tripartite tricarboxylate transporter substrate binding protein [Phreatobacter stygius]|uniref:Tripartite tricarboxylate transporter substrate binding protein n=1 Tax=Phreatobacter stygius TaxID=1940610 RepID=A0A4D7AZM1_9HYPH|nr:tripartite tricarboxylate transporter substrate-binding protein [Phreatobacter stygius]QCI66854.1 tripartite tricarboxylate transporter substrate binding protein [Phreatobacter stygius]
MLTRRSAIAALSIGSIQAASSPARAQAFTKQVTLIVPFAPGGTSDILARFIGPKLSQAIGQPVIVDNRPSSSGNVGADYVARAPGDGHTLLLSDAGTLASVPALFKKLSFDVSTDLVPIGMVSFSPYLFAVHPSIAANTIEELAAFDKANPGKLNVATSGVGAVNHLTALVIGKRFGINWGAVPYRGGAAAIRGVVANESNVIFNGAIATLPFVTQGQLKGIAVSGEKRLAQLPNLPSFKELNTPIHDTGSWQGIYASKGTPPAMVARLNAELGKILAMPDVSAKIVELGSEVKAGSAAEFAAWMTKAMAEWGAIVKAENLSLD